jgi:hypothetical protein
MKPTLFTIIIILSSFFNASSQIFSGKVVNSNDKPLPFATISILKSDRYSVLISSTTDNFGQFKMQVKDSTGAAKYICASYLKSKSDTVSIRKGESEFKLVIANSVVALSEVTVDAEAPTMVKKADRFIFTPTKSLTAGASALDVVRIAPLIHFDNKSEFFSIINRAGTVVYINNRKTIMPKEMVIALLKSSSGDNVKSIEIITNPGSEYPANSAGGVININLKKMADEGWSGFLGLGSEQSKYNTTTLNGAITYRKNKVGIRLSPFINNSFNYNTVENAVEPSAGQFQDNFRTTYRKYRVLGGGLGIDYDISRRTLLSFNGFVSTVSGKSTQASSTSYATQGRPESDSIYSAPIAGKDHYIYNFGNIYLQHSLDTLNKQQLTFNVDYNQFNQRNDDRGSFVEDYPVSGNPIKQAYHNILPEKFFNVSERLDYSSQVTKASKINLGAQVSSTDVSDDLKYFDLNPATGTEDLNRSLSNHYKYKENYFALYATYTTTFSEKLNGTLGLRAENTAYSTENITSLQKVDSSYLKVFPNLSMAYSPNKDNTFSLALSRRIQRPQIELLFPGRTYYNPNYFSENNPFLLPVILYNGEVMYSLLYKYYLSAGFNQSSNQYAQFIILQTVNGNLLQKKTYLNYGNTGNSYLSLYIIQKWFKGFWDMNLSANLNYDTYSVNRQGNLLLTTSKKNLNYNFSINNTYHLSNRSKWIAFAFFKYNSPVENISYRRENVLFSTDIGVRKTFNNISLGLFLSDLFNTSAKSTTSFQSSAAYLYNRVIQNDYTRSIAVNVRYLFGNKKIKGLANKNVANDDIKSRIN